MVFLNDNDKKINVYDICLFFVCLIAFPVHYFCGPSSACRSESFLLSLCKNR
jgi:hypothetical protein